MSIFFFFSWRRVPANDAYSEPRKHDRELVLSKLTAFLQVSIRASRNPVALIDRARAISLSLFSLSLSPFSPIGCHERGWVYTWRAIVLQSRRKWNLIHGMRCYYVARVRKYAIFSYFLCVHNSVLPADFKINFKIKRKHIDADPIFDDDRDAGSNVLMRSLKITVYGFLSEVLSKVFQHEISRSVIEQTHLSNRGSSSASLLDESPSGQPTFRGQSHVCKSWLEEAKPIFFFFILNIDYLWVRLTRDFTRLLVFFVSLKLHLRNARRVISNFANVLQRHFLYNLTPFPRLSELPYTPVFFPLPVVAIKYSPWINDKRAKLLRFQIPDYNRKITKDIFGIIQYIYTVLIV